jgi:hypothetical protein
VWKCQLRVQKRIKSGVKNKTMKYYPKIGLEIHIELKTKAMLEYF